MDNKIRQSSKLFSIIIFILINIMILPKATSGVDVDRYSCNTSMFDSGSEYETNLYNLFTSLSSNATNPSGYYTATAGNTTSEVAYGHFLCRGDQTTSSCQDCVTAATTSDLPHCCANQKEAVIWYEQCMVRYSNRSFFGKLETQPNVTYASNQNVTGNITKFQEFVGNMMNNAVAVRAAGGGSQKKYGTESTHYTLLIPLYGLGQCTPDLSPDDCKTCLKVGSQMLQTYMMGARGYLPSCNLRFETYRFFNLPSSTPPPTSGESDGSNQSSGDSNNSSVDSSHSSGDSNNSSGDSNHSSGGKKNLVKVISLAVVIPVATILMTLLVFGIRRVKHKKQRSYDGVAETGEDFSSAESLQYDLATLQLATNNFSDENKLGEGGFGSVYKATKSNGEQVAVKRLSKTSSQGIQQFKTEIFLVAKLQHRNLVRLLGFCFEGQEKLLVYEYILNKSLDNFLFDAKKQGLLSWDVRYTLIRGIARGMLYLHHDSQPRIIHRDLKASNVLLDANMNPKISDFGMARIFGGDQSQANTSRVVGTFGYMSPEYAMHGQFSVKSDVYSFGVLVLEIITGKRNTTFYQSGDAEDLLSYAWKQWRDGKFLDIIDPTIKDSCSNDEVMRCTQLGLLCVQESPDDRPTMATAVLTLDSYSTTLPSPDVPGFFIKSIRNSNHRNEFGSSDHSSSKSTKNDVSISGVEPR